MLNVWKENDKKAVPNRYLNIITLKTLVVWTITKIMMFIGHAV